MVVKPSGAVAQRNRAEASLPRKGTRTTVDIASRSTAFGGYRGSDGNRSSMLERRGRDAKEVVVEVKVILFQLVIIW